MAEGKFKIPLETYYSVSGDIKSKVTDLVDSVEENFLNKVTENSGILDPRDATIVEGFSSYTMAKTELETLKDHETNLKNMSSEGGSNPLNGVVTIDNSYASTFSSVAQGTANSQVSAVMGNLNSQIEAQKTSQAVIDFCKKYGKEIGDNDTVQRLLQLAKTNPAKVLEKLYDNDKFVETILKSDASSDFFELVISKADLLKKVPTKLMDTLSDSEKFVGWASKLSIDKQDKVMNAMISISEKGYDFLNKGGKFVEWTGKIAELRPVQILSKFANTGLGKFVASPWVMVGGHAVISGVSSYMDKDGKTYHDVGKSAAGGAIDAIASVGPLDGALMGASVGGAPGAVAGFLIGATIQTVQFIDPHAKDKVKNFTYDKIDEARKAGKAISQNIQNFTSSAGDTITKGTNEFKKGISEVGKSAQKFMTSMVSPSLNWFG
ncbi:hypothetical protein [Streptococcus parauberis]|uniref:hypothetical protein n=1 Tax=Streptococcus parauberis TaxID=1348 RepID=UPI000CCFA6CC|nr:hypothetical protein [Streptococcus parauberis]PNY19770.1 hypothetical protein ASN86_00595 [Streptococcus parauberis]